MKYTIATVLLPFITVTTALTPNHQHDVTPRSLTPRNETWQGVTAHLVKETIDVMNKVWYNSTDGRWDSITAWWLTGNALQAVADYMYATGDTSYLAQAAATIEKQSAPLPWWPEGGGDFRADSTDDTGWWALALLRLYDLTHDPSYLATAQLDEAYMYSYWLNSTCNGGLIWNIPTLSYKNAISNELYIKLAAGLHNRLPHSDSDTPYLARAQQAWDWFNVSHGMINSATHLINDGLLESCVNNNATVWSYNQGVVLGGLVELAAAAQQPAAYLAEARSIADAVLASEDYLSPRGILTESCEAAGCDNNQQAFKGIFMRNLAELNVVLEGRPYTSYLNRNARSAWFNAQNGTSSRLFGLKWAGPYTNASVGTQSSVISLLVANLWK